ncbi:MAG: hypothetical protein FWC93_02985 [Defluviitaleaceae bacterium]|nr:hypothetical protein [Defluviitaleaceae bacterium]
MIYKVDEGFLISEYNPFAKIAYDNSWIIFCLTDSEDYHTMNGGIIKSAYTLRVSRRCPQWRMSVMDFIGFNESRNKNIVLSISDEDLKEAENFYGQHSFDDKYLRDYEPEFLIHSTTRENWESIKKDYCLKSWNILKRERPDWEHSPIGKQLGDPDDFSNYIMFSSGSISGEIVVLSKQKGSVTMQDVCYKPGVRLYFDARKIAKHGLLVRDGCHLKVKDTLPLSPYLTWVGDWKSAGLASNVSTPKEFTVAANEKFNELFNAKVKTTF